MPNFKICMCFSDTGGGHRSAAEAIEAAIENVQREKVSDNTFELTEENVIEKTHPLNRGFVDLYNFLLRHNQAAMRYYYWFIETFRPNNSDIGYKIAKPWLEKFIHEQKADVIVSAHPMCNHYLARILKDTGMAGTIKLITVVTDPNGKFWHGWACLEADLTLVPNDLGAAQLVEWGVSPDKIKIVGMTVHPDFTKPPVIERKEFLESLRLHPEKFTVCLNAGWAGGGNMVHIYRQLAQVDRDIQVIFLCGHNTRLYEQMRQEALKYDILTHVLPFHDSIADLMSAVDLMVTKAGGLTTFESLARKLPIAFDLITAPMPQEVGTVELLVKQNLATEIRKPEDIVKIVMDMKPVANREEVVLPAVHQLDKVYAADTIARWIMSFCDKSYAPGSDSTVSIHESSQGAAEQSNTQSH